MLESGHSNKTLQILQAAEQEHHGVLAAIAYNVEHVTAFVRAAEACRSPLILQLFPSTLKQLPSLVYAASAASRSASVPISLHLDHAQDEQQIREVVENMPFDSIMVDMSHFEHEKNLAKTKKLTRICHEKNIAVEAESGRINGGEDGIADTGELEALFTSPQEVEDFLEAEIDILAPSVGNIHGDYPPTGPELDFERLQSIRQQVRGRTRIALHGTNDFSAELMKECIAAGATKINVNKLLLERWNQYLKHNAHLPITQLIDQGMDVLQKETVRWMTICGSAGRC